MTRILITAGNIMPGDVLDDPLFPEVQGKIVKVVKHVDDEKRVYFRFTDRTTFWLPKESGSLYWILQPE